MIFWPSLNVFFIAGYAFHVTNPDEVQAGMKPILKEVGPFVYKAVTVKDSRDTLDFNDDGETLTYKPRLAIITLLLYYVFNCLFKY